MKNSAVRAMSAIAATSAAAVAITIVAAHAASSQPTLPGAKQAVIDHENSVIAGRNPHPVPPDPAASSHSAQACTRDVSALISGISPAFGQGDFPDWLAYTFTDEWVDPSGSVALQAGNASGTNQGLVTVERWTPPTSCMPKGAVYLAPAGSGQLTITSVSWPTASLQSSAGSSWTFNLTTDTFQQSP
jgi:hypothetical protein